MKILQHSYSECEMILKKIDRGVLYHGLVTANTIEKYPKCGVILKAQKNGNNFRDSLARSQIEIYLIECLQIHFYTIQSVHILQPISIQQIIMFNILVIIINQSLILKETGSS